MPRSTIGFVLLSEETELLVLIFSGQRSFSNACAQWVTFHGCKGSLMGR